MHLVCLDLRAAFEQVARPRQVAGKMIGCCGQVAMIDDELRSVVNDVALAWSRGEIGTVSSLKSLTGTVLI
jgi:hypothetical protein